MEKYVRAFFMELFEILEISKKLSLSRNRICYGLFVKIYNIWTIGGVTSSLGVNCLFYFLHTVDVKHAQMYILLKVWLLTANKICDIKYNPMLSFQVYPHCYATWNFTQVSGLRICQMSMLRVKYSVTEDPVSCKL